MKVLQVHNTYTKRGGEDTVVEEEKVLLESQGHEVYQYLKSNDEIVNLSWTDKLGRLMSIADAPAIREEFSEIIDRFKPDICHVHNVFSVISPGIYQVCQDKGIPVVQTIHNYRLICTNTQLYRENHTCEECVGGSLYHSVVRKCYRGSYLQTAIMAYTLMTHRAKGTWHNDIDAYICLTEFAKNKLVQGGLPENKMIVRPNFIKLSKHPASQGDYFIFIGRAEDSKGIFDLVEVIKELPNIKLVVIGNCDFPELFKDIENVQYFGLLPREETLHWLAGSRALIFPSRWYEGMPMVILEAFSLSKPVIARNLGAMTSMIKNGTNGFLFNDNNQLKQLISNLEESPKIGTEIGKLALKEYVDRYSPIAAYKSLMEVYSSAIQNRERKGKKVIY